MRDQHEKNDSCKDHLLVCHCEHCGSCTTWVKNDRLLFGKKVEDVHPADLNFKLVYLVSRRWPLSESL